MSADGERENIRAEAAHVVTHALQVTKASRRVTVRGLVSRDDDSFWRVATDAAPFPETIAEQHEQTCECDEHATIVPKEPAQTLSLRRRSDQSLWESEDDREAFVGPKWLRDAVTRDARADQLSDVSISLCSLWTGVGLRCHQVGRDGRG